MLNSRNTFLKSYRDEHTEWWIQSEGGHDGTSHLIAWLVIY